MAFENGKSAQEKNANASDPNLRRTLQYLSRTWADWILCGPTYGVEALQGDQAEQDFITARNAEVASYWTSQRTVAGEVLRRDAGDKGHMNLALVMCNGLEVFNYDVGNGKGIYQLPLCNGTMLTVASNEQDCMKGMFLGTDTFVASNRRSPVKPLYEILAKAGESTVYDKYWVDEGGTEYFTPPAEWTTHFTTTSYAHKIFPNRAVGDA